MSQMNLHILDAQKNLTAQKEWIHNSLSSTYERAERTMQIPPLDVVVKCGKSVIKEKGHFGYCPEPGLVYMTVDPDNPAFLKNDAESFERMFAHELHHVARWAGPGYGTTLGEALVSEGLAGHFALEIFGGNPEIWECLNADTVQSYHFQIKEHWNSTEYDHFKWFYGTKDLPCWLGYTAGFNLVARYLKSHPQYNASMLSNADASEFKAFV